MPLWLHPGVDDRDDEVIVNKLTGFDSPGSELAEGFLCQKSMNTADQCNACTRCALQLIMIFAGINAAECKFEAETVTKAHYK